MAVQNILPDPVNTIDEAGQDLSGGVAGPGYKTVKLSSVQDVLTARSRSGITYRRINQYHQWKIDITYNKLTKTQFDTVYPFLLQRQSFQEAFFVNLPQYNNTGSITSSVPNLSQPAGQHYLTVTNSANVQKGDLLTISDSTDATHKKAYKITAIDSSNHYLYLTPTLQRKVDTTSGATIVFDVATPKIRVIAVGSTVDYSLDSSGLYSFSVKLEEALS
tara:strand:+ start:388 stop:1044 length:657 start_codon:yes stop_codon:yes gene_type:complete